MKTSEVIKQPSRQSTSIRVQRVTLNRRLLRVRKVLVPTDFSAASLQALEYALPLIKSFGADLHLAHVSEPNYPLTNMTGLPLMLPECKTPCLVRRDLQRVARKYSIQLDERKIHSCQGRPFEEICQLAQEQGIDLIIMSTRGHTGFRHFALGSTAERIVRHSHCPVLVVHPTLTQGKGNRKSGLRKLSFERIIVPIDFSECSMDGLTYAKGLAKRFGSELVLLNSVALHYYITSDEYPRYDLPQLMQRGEQSAREQMQILLAKTDWKGIKVTPSFQIGHAGQQICREALDQDADMIITSTHGITGFKHMLVGSTAEYVVRHASCPVLVVPSHERPAFT